MKEKWLRSSELEESNLTISEELLLKLNEDFKKLIFQGEINRHPVDRNARLWVSLVLPLVWVRL